MQKNTKNREYIEFGNKLREWRTKKFTSSLALFKATEFSFSYGIYNSFERGETIPNPAQLIEIVTFFVINQIDAMMFWAGTQMPTEELKNVFKGILKTRDKKPKLTADVAPSIDSTWVFGPPEKKLLEKNPWLLEICSLLCTEHPKEIPLNELPCPKGVTPSMLEKKYLHSWIQDGHIIKTKNGVRTRLPHVYLPKTEYWDEIRKNNVKRGIENVLNTTPFDYLTNHKTIRILLNRPVTNEQVNSWVTRLSEIEPDFMNEPYIEQPDAHGTQNAQNYGLYIVFGPRTIRKN